jgi:phosphatidylserine/phosphatidylglycerophosphate/cardiolipin synthase-like enzyme
MELLNTTELNYKIEKMFEKERDYLIILSPYLNINKKLEIILKDSSAKIIIIYRECNNINYYKKELSNAFFFQIKTLHAKAYISKEITIITSLNLIEYSQINNFELGILFENNTEREMYEKLYDEIQILLKTFDPEINLHSYIKEYRMRDLYWNLLEKNGKSDKTDNENNKLYKFVCDEMLKKYDFKKYDFYQDNSAIYRHTIITKDMYEFGINNINL